jgi:hypothetical protein
MLFSAAHWCWPFPAGLHLATGFFSAGFAALEFIRETYSAPLLTLNPGAV